jgi:hypothetical protein
MVDQNNSAGLFDTVEPILTTAPFAEWVTDNLPWPEFVIMVTEGINA